MVRGPVENQPNFLRDMSPSSSGSKNKAGRSKASSTGFLLGLFFAPEDGGDIFLRNVD
jgi:hypothetical protein